MSEQPAIVAGAAVSTVELTAEIVAAYLANPNNSVPPSEIGNVIREVSASLTTLSNGGAAAQADVAPQTPAVPVKKSVTNEYLICLEDGRKFKSLKRHLRAKYDLTPEAYRAKWNLPADYPMTAPAYSEARSSLAKSIGLGQGGRGSKPAVAPTEATEGSEGAAAPKATAPKAPRKNARKETPAEAAVTTEATAAAQELASTEA